MQWQFFFISSRSTRTFHSLSSSAVQQRERIARRKKAGEESENKFNFDRELEPVDESSTVEVFFLLKWGEECAIKYLLGSFYERLGEFSGSQRVFFRSTIVDCFVGHKFQLRWSLKLGKKKWARKSAKNCRRHCRMWWKIAEHMNCCAPINFVTV